MYLLPENIFAPVSCALVAVMLSCYQRHVVRYQSLPQNSKMGLLTRLFEITGHSYPSFSSIRHGGSTGNSLGKLEKKNMFKLQKSVTKVFFGCLVAAKKMIFRLILREKNILFSSFSKKMPIDPSWRNEENEGYEWPAISKNLVRRPAFVFCI